MNSKIICFLRKLLKIDVFEEAMKKTDNFAYLTPEYISDLDGISIKAAENKLEKATADGFMKKKYLYTNIDLDLNIIVEESQIGTNIVIDGLPESMESNEVFISSNYVRKIYVSS